jgi:hypothetical protein
VTRVVPIAGALSEAMLSAHAATSGHAWPSALYAADPIGFATHVLGVELWEKQQEILEAVRDHARVTVRSGHKVGKSLCAATIALWFYCSFADARVVMSSVTSRQVDEILWRELSMRHRRALVPIGGELAKLARSGLKSEDFRQICGFTAKEAEAVAGISGPNLLYLLDEASGVPDIIYEAIEGNRAGGARVVLFGNPTKNSGEFFASHNSKRDLYQCIHVSSEDTPNASGRGKAIPGLATRAWVEEKRVEWGEESALYQVRVAGNFPREEARKVIQLHLVTEAEERWEETAAVGRLHVGVDPAGLGDDASGMAARRGARVLQVRAVRLDEDELEAEVIQFIREHRGRNEAKAAVKVDVSGGSGGAGAKMAARLRAKAYEDEIDVVGVDFGPLPVGADYPTRRDQIWFGTSEWLRAGGALPPERLADGRANPMHDKKLAAELIAPGYELDARSRPKLEPKEAVSARLKRSPDRADALCLAVHEPASTRLEQSEETARAADANWYEVQERGIDPYAALSATLGGGRRR